MQMIQLQTPESKTFDKNEALKIKLSGGKREVSKNPECPGRGLGWTWETAKG